MLGLILILKINYFERFFVVFSDISGVVDVAYDYRIRLIIKFSLYVSQESKVDLFSS